MIGFFASLTYRPKVVFIQQKLCFTKDKICENFDIQGDILVTPKKL